MPIRVATRRLSTALDPTVAVVLWGLAVAAVVAGAVGAVFDWWSVKDMLPVFGGIIVLLGSYFAARTLSETERDRATQMLASDQAAVRVAGIYRLGEVATYIPRHREYVEIALRAYLAAPAKDDQHARDLASTLLAEVPRREQGSDDDSDTLAPWLIKELRARKRPKRPCEPAS